jgi:hypothetical protein
MHSFLRLPRTRGSTNQLLIALLLAAILVVMAILQSRPQTVEPYDPDDTSSTGLRALVLWLEELDHPVSISVPRSGLPSGPGLLWIHPAVQLNSDTYSDADVASTYDWVRSGGTLVLVGPVDPYTPLAQRFGVEQTQDLSGIVSNVRQVQPLLLDLPATLESIFAMRALSFRDERAVVPVLAHLNGDPVVALQLIGDGVVWHLTEDFALTNLNLRNEQIATLLPAILRTVPANAPVIFSTHHLARYDQSENELATISTLQDWLYTTPFGQALFVTMIVLFAFLLLQGRRLGPPLPALTATRPREAAEYVTALAGLQRRTRQPRVVADHYRQRLKSAIGKLAQVPADLPDAEWLAQLHRAEVLAPTQLAQVEELLSGYAQVDNDADLIPLVQATDALLALLPRATLYTTQLVR